MSHRMGDTAGCALHAASGSMHIRGASTAFVSHFGASFEQLLTGPQDIRRFSCILPCPQPFPRCLRTGVCIRRRTFHLTSFACVSSRNLYHSCVRNSYHTAHWRVLGSTCPDKCFVCAADMATFSKPRRVLWIWYGVFICGLCRDSATMVHHEKEPGERYCDRRERPGGDDVQLSC